MNSSSRNISGKIDPESMRNLTDREDSGLYT